MEQGGPVRTPIKQEDASGAAADSGRYASLAVLPFSAAELQRLTGKYLRPYIADHGRNTRRGRRLIPHSRVQQRYATLAVPLQQLEKSASASSAGPSSSQQQQLLHALRCLELWEGQVGYTPLPRTLASLMGDNSSDAGAGPSSTAAGVVEVVDMSTDDPEVIDIEAFVLDCVLLRVVKPDPNLACIAPKPTGIKPDPEEHLQQSCAMSLVQLPPAAQEDLIDLLTGEAWRHLRQASKGMQQLVDSNTTSSPFSQAALQQPCFTSRFENVYSLQLSDDALEQGGLAALASGCPNLSQLWVKAVHLDELCNAAPLHHLTELYVDHTFAALDQASLAAVFPCITNLRLLCAFEVEDQVTLLDGAISLQVLDAGVKHLHSAYWDDIYYDVDDDYVDTGLYLRSDVLSNLPQLLLLPLNCYEDHVNGIGLLSSLRQLTFVFVGRDDDFCARFQEDGHIFGGADPPTALEHFEFEFVGLDSYGGTPTGDGDEVFGEERHMAVNAAIEWLIKAPALHSVDWSVVTYVPEISHTMVINDARMHRLLQCQSLQYFDGPEFSMFQLLSPATTKLMNDRGIRCRSSGNSNSSDDSSGGGESCSSEDSR